MKLHIDKWTRVLPAFGTFLDMREAKGERGTVEVFSDVGGTVLIQGPSGGALVLGTAIVGGAATTVQWTAPTARIGVLLTETAGIGGAFSVILTQTETTCGGG